MPDDVDGIGGGVVGTVGLAEEGEGGLAGDVQLFGVVAGKDEDGVGFCGGVGDAVDGGLDGGEEGG